MPHYDFEKYFDFSLEMLCIASTNGYFKRVNNSFQRTLGRTKEELTNRPFVDFIHPEDIAATLEEVDRLSSGVPTEGFQNRYRCANGKYRHFQWKAFPEPESGLLFASARDTTDIVETNQRFQVVIDASPAALILVDQRGRIQLVNRETERLFGYSRDLLIGETIEMLVPANSRGKHQQDRADYFQEPSSRPMGGGRHLSASRRDGVVFPAEIALQPVEFGGETYVLSTVIDLTIQKQVEERMTQLARELEDANARLGRLAMTDRLTHVFNRRALDEQLDKQIQLMGRMGRELSLIMLDIDNFKQHNDQYGHTSGDEMLKNIASLLTKNARATDFVSRYGGDEFAIVMPDTSKAGALRMAERFRIAIRTHSREQFDLTVSMGIFTLLLGKEACGRSANHSAKLLSESDRALYFSKRSGRDQVTHISDMQIDDQST